LAPEKICARRQSTRRNQKKPENAGRDPKVGKDLAGLGSLGKRQKEKGRGGIMSHLSSFVFQSQWVCSGEAPRQHRVVHLGSGPFYLSTSAYGLLDRSSCHIRRAEIEMTGDLCLTREFEHDTSKYVLSM
jgi:hypothetical protein